MVKFEVTVTREDKYVIELDENALDQEWMEWFRSWFYKFDSLEDHAKHLAQMRARFGDIYYEGYGNVLVDGEKSWRLSENDKANEAINIKVLSEDEDIYIDASEVK